jgi:hypothetical protein
MYINMLRYLYKEKKSALRNTEFAITSRDCQLQTHNHYYRTQRVRLHLALRSQERRSESAGNYGADGR